MKTRDHDHERAHVAPGHAPVLDGAPLAAHIDRRAFLRLAGFTLGAAGIAGCTRGPAQTAMSLLDADEHVVPGRRYEIATTSWADGTGGGLLAQCRDGRPVKLEGNPDHPVNRGGLTATAQASLLSLYDDRRYDAPQLDGRASTLDEVDALVRERLVAAGAAGRDGAGVRVLSGTLTGPSTLALLERLREKLPGARHVMYDALSCSALLDAQAATRGARVLPRLDLSRAAVLSAFDADLLGTWVSPAGYAADYAQARRPDAAVPTLSRHWQFESQLSLTGARADRRVLLAPWEIAPALARLGAALARKAGVEAPGPVPAADALRPAARAALDELAAELWSRRGESLVVCGRNDHDAQLLCAWVNELLGATGRTQHLERPSLQRRGDDRALATLREELLAGQVDLLIVAGCNPAYDLPDFGPALSRAGLLVATAGAPDETSMLARVVVPEPHELERWDDAEPIAGVYATTQPTLPALRPGRTLRASLARWLGDARDERALLADFWRQSLAPRRPTTVEPFEAWFARVLERGFVELGSPNAQAPAPFNARPVGEALARLAAAPAAAPADDALGLVLHATVGLLDGRGAHNPWLQELPDPISKTVWDNHASFAPATAARLGIASGDIVRLRAAGAAPLELPALVQPGQDERVVCVPLGYGRLGTDRFTDIGPDWIEAQPTVPPGSLVGANAALLQVLAEGLLRTDARSVTIERTGARRPPACTQDHHSLRVPAHLAPHGGEVRDAVRVVALPDLIADPAGALGAGHAATGELWADDHASPLFRWGMAIDLAACTGCSACVVSCQAENNVPVVGRDEVARHREMSWMRIDRYYADLPDGGVEVSHQPMLCQHCGHAPCETVCPVLATMHSREGLNQQVYNRCVGTRYCANNCPYKVRRFNWFDYAREDRLQNMVLNPDVTIRSRGVMEKCSLCVQRIQAGKAAARREGRVVRDGDIVTACQQSCASRAIVFGDLNDPGSAVSRKLAAARAYEVLGELNVQPAVRYLADVRNAPSVAGGKGMPDHG